MLLNALDAAGAKYNLVDEPVFFVKEGQPPHPSQNRSLPAREIRPVRLHLRDDVVVRGAHAGAFAHCFVGDDPEVQGGFEVGQQAFQVGVAAGEAVGGAEIIAHRPADAGMVGEILDLFGTAVQVEIVLRGVEARADRGAAAADQALLRARTVPAQRDIGFAVGQIGGIVLDRDLDADARIGALEGDEGARQPVGADAFGGGDHDEARQGLVLGDHGAFDGGSLVAHALGMCDNLLTERGEP